MTRSALVWFAGTLLVSGTIMIDPVMRMREYSAAQICGGQAHDCIRCDTSGPCPDHPPWTLPEDNCPGKSHDLCPSFRCKRCSKAGRDYMLCGTFRIPHWRCYDDDLMALTDCGDYNEYKCGWIFSCTCDTLQWTGYWGRCPRGCREEQK